MSLKVQKTHGLMENIVFIRKVSGHSLIQKVFVPAAFVISAYINTQAAEKIIFIFEIVEFYFLLSSVRDLYHSEDILSTIISQINFNHVSIIVCSDWLILIDQFTDPTNFQNK